MPASTSKKLEFAKVQCEVPVALRFVSRKFYLDAAADNSSHSGVQTLSRTALTFKVSRMMYNDCEVNAM